MTLRAAPSERSPADLLDFGVVNLDKPPGPSSHQVAAWVRDLTETDKAAHTGTLDPNVTGCLPVLLGTATRLASALLEQKEYVAILQLHGPVPSDLDAVIAAFEGPIYQKPPRKSAVARELRVRTIESLTVLEQADRQLLLRIRCESGTYIRKLCHDLGLALGTGGHMAELRRTATTPFDDRTLVTLHGLTDALVEWRDRGDTEALSRHVFPAERALRHLPRVTIAPSAAREVANGAPVYAPGVIDTDTSSIGTTVACYTPNDAVVCLGDLVGNPTADSGKVVDLTRVLV